MPVNPPATDPPRALIRGLAPLIGLILLGGLVYYAIGRQELTLEALVRQRTAIDGFVTAHRILAVLAFIGVYIAAVALSVPGALLLTVAGGFLFELVTGAAAAVVGATAGATFIFLVARSALGEPLLRRVGPRASQLAQGFRNDAFSYLLFLRLVPAFPFFLVNIVPAFAGVRLAPFVAATALGIIPGSIIYAYAGTSLDSIIAAQKATYELCVAAGRSGCQMSFDPRDILTPHILGALLALALLALVPVAVRRLRGRRSAAL